MVFDTAPTSPDWRNGINRIKANILDYSARDCVRTYVLEQIKKATNACNHLKNQSDPDALHDFRVAVRRQRVWIRVFKDYHHVGRKLRKKLEALTDSTNKCRDLEVCRARLITYQPVILNSCPDSRKDLETLIDCLAREHELAFSEITARLPYDWNTLKTTLKRRINKVKTGDKVKDRLDCFIGKKILKMSKTIDDNLGLIHGIDDQSVIHKTRICFKKLRYLIEPLNKQISSLTEIIVFLKNMQDILGDYRDAHILIELLNSNIEAPYTFRKNEAYKFTFNKIIECANQQALDKFNHFRMLFTSGQIQQIMLNIRSIGNDLRYQQDTHRLP